VQTACSFFLKFSEIDRLMEILKLMKLSYGGGNTAQMPDINIVGGADFAPPR